MPPTVVAAESDSQGCGSRKQQGCLADGAQVCAPCLSCLQNLYLPFVLGLLPASWAGLLLSAGPAKMAGWPGRDRASPWSISVT